MPTIQSKKYPDNVQYIDSEGWENFKRLGKDRLFTILDSGDIEQTVIPAPEQIIDFVKPESPQAENVEKVLSREEIKAELDKHEQEYNTRASTDKLNEQLNTYLESL